MAWEVADRPVSDERVRAAAEAALEHGSRPGIELSIVFVDDPTLAALHARWLGDSAPTDVISFDLGAEGGGPAGELFVSVERAAAVAAEMGHDPATELLLYVVHGTLHLCGFDDHGEAQRARMRAAERQVFAVLGLAAAPWRVADEERGACGENGDEMMS